MWWSLISIYVAALEFDERVRAQKSIKDGFEQDQEEQEKENPKKDAPAQKSEQSRVPDSIEPENQKLTAEKTAGL